MLLPRTPFKNKLPLLQLKQAQVNSLTLRLQTAKPILKLIIEILMNKHRKKAIQRPRQLVKGSRIRMLPSYKIKKATTLLVKVKFKPHQ
jgi:hypothetical protein